MKTRNMNAAIATSLALGIAPGIAEAKVDQKAFRHMDRTEHQLAGLVADQFRQEQATPDPHVETAIRKLKGQSRSIRVVIEAGSSIETTDKYILSSTMDKVAGKLDPTTSSKVSIAAYNDVALGQPASDFDQVTSFEIEYQNIRPFLGKRYAKHPEKQRFVQGTYREDLTPVACGPDAAEGVKDCIAVSAKQMSSLIEYDFNRSTFYANTFGAMVTDALAVYDDAINRRPVTETRPSPLG